MARTWPNCKKNCSIINHANFFCWFGTRERGFRLGEDGVTTFNPGIDQTLSRTRALGDFSRRERIIYLGNAKCVVFLCGFNSSVGWFALGCTWIRACHWVARWASKERMGSKCRACSSPSHRLLLRNFAYYFVHSKNASLKRINCSLVARAPDINDAFEQQFEY
jgi:hypothetical protein